MTGEGPNTGARLAIHLKDGIDHFEHTDGSLLGLTNDSASSNYSMTGELQSTLEASRIDWPALRNHIPSMAHVIQLALGAFMRSIGVKGSTKSWEAHERNQQFGENQSIDIGQSQRLRKEGNARIYRVSAMRPGLANIIEKVRIARYFESPETDLYIAEIACCIDYADTWSSKWVHSLSNSHSPHCGTADYGCEHLLEQDTGVARTRLPITRILTQVGPKSKIQWSPATLHNTSWIDHCEVYHGTIESIPILNPVNVEDAYGSIASSYHIPQCHVPSYGWRCASFG